MNSARCTLSSALALAALVLLSGCGLGAGLAMGLAAKASGRSPGWKKADTPVSISTASFGPSASFAVARDRLLALADAFADEAPDLIAVRDAYAPHDVERLLDELRRRGHAYETASRGVEHVILLRSDADLVALDPASGPFVDGLDEWTSVSIAWDGGEVRVVVTDLTGPEAPAQVDELLSDPDLAVTSVIVACGLDIEDPVTGLLATDGLEVIGEAPLGGLLLGRGVAGEGDR